MLLYNELDFESPVKILISMLNIQKLENLAKILYIKNKYLFR